MIRMIEKTKLKILSFQSGAEREKEKKTNIAATYLLCAGTDSFTKEDEEEISLFIA